jgi:hypothetical protein
VSLPFVISAMLAAVIMFFRDSSSRLASMFVQKGGLRGLELFVFVYGLGGLWLVLYLTTTVFSPSYASSLILYLSASAVGGVLIVFVAVLILYRVYKKRYGKG